MPFTLVVVGTAVAVGYLRGGRFSRMAEANLQGTWLLFVGLILQFLVDLAASRGVLEGTDGYLLLLASQLLVVAWALWNWYRPGVGLVVVGLVLNAVVIGANGAMPVDLDAIAALGFDVEGAPLGKHVLMTDATRLAFLGDVIALPPLRTIISIGDIVLAAGLIVLVHHLMTYRPPAERRGGARMAASDAPEA